MTAIKELAADRTVEGVYAVARKQRRTTRAGKPYLVLDLVDPSGRIEARIWDDVELLDRRFEEGDAIRLLGQVEQFDGKLQIRVRTLEGADTDPGELAPTMRRDADELLGFLAQLESELDRLGFFNPGHKRQMVMRNVHTMFARMQASEQEVRTLRGIVATLAKGKGHGRKPST